MAPATPISHAPENERPLGAGPVVLGGGRTTVSVSDSRRATGTDASRRIGGTVGLSKIEGETTGGLAVFAGAGSTFATGTGGFSFGGCTAALMIGASALATSMG